MKDERPRTHESPRELARQNEAKREQAPQSEAIAIDSTAQFWPQTTGKKSSGTQGNQDYYC